MPYRIRGTECVDDALRRIADEQIARALAELDDDELDRHETVHQVRKRCKKVRGLLRLVRGALPRKVYQPENEAFRDASRLLSYVRDAGALVETYDDLLDAFDDEVDRRAFAPVRRKLTERRKRIADDQVGLDDSLATFAARMANAKARVSTWSLDAREFAAVADGLKRTYRRARKAMAEAQEDGDGETLHEWRKRAKYHWYHMRLLRDVWRPVLTTRRDEVKEVSSALGDDRNLLVFRETLVSAPDEFGNMQALDALIGLIDRRRAELQATARRVGAKAFAEKPKHLVRRFRVYWEAWREDMREHDDPVAALAAAGK